MSLLKLCEKNESPHHTVVSFAFKLATACHQFDKGINEKLISEGILKRYFVVIEQQKKLETPSVLLSYVVLLKEIGRTKGGLSYLKETSLWKSLINYESPNFTIYVVREMATFFYEIMKAFDVSGEDSVVKMILEEILGKEKFFNFFL